ncbi:MAG: polysaccharide deacetylase family protein [Ktedonobacterales bacterium]
MKYSDLLGLSPAAQHTGGRLIATIPATSGATSTPVATPTATPTPQSNTRYNQQMGCSFSAPRPLPAAVFSAQTASNPAATTKEVAITFDDGPTPYSTPPILAMLERTHTPATFFVEGGYAHTWPYLIERERSDGFAIGVHTWDHPPMTRLTPDQRHFQLGATLDTLHSIMGADACIWFWRPPYGDYNGPVMQDAGAFGLTTIIWDVDPRDWERPGTGAIVSRVLADVHAGSIILLHDGPALREQTADALPAILAGLKTRGLTPVTLPRLLADNKFPGVYIFGLPQGHTQPSAP